VLVFVIQTYSDLFGTGSASSINEPKSTEKFYCKVNTNDNNDCFIGKVDREARHKAGKSRGLFAKIVRGCTHHASDYLLTVQ
jgi:hypothetical protein